MPLLSYANTFPPTPFTKIYSADVTSWLNSIKTLLNTTGLDDTNIQAAGITRGTKLKTGTASYVIINDGTGAMSEEAQLAITRGGTGLNITVGSQSPGDVIQVNSSSSALTVSAPTGVAASLRLYQYNNLG